MSTLKSRARQPVARALLALARRRAGRVGAALCYHRVGDPQGRAGWELVPPLGTQLFDAQLAMLAARFRLVSASERRRDTGRPAPVLLAGAPAGARLRPGA